MTALIIILVALAAAFGASTVERMSRVEPRGGRDWGKTLTVMVVVALGACFTAIGAIQ